MVMMKKICCIKCSKYENLENPKISYTFYKIIDFSIICDKCGCNDENYLKKKNKLIY